MIGEANFSDHGANRLGASALMQGLADGYFVLPYTIGDYLASTKLDKVDASASGGSARPSRSVDVRHEAAARHQGHAHGGFVPPRAGQAHVGLLRHGAHGRGPEDGARARFPQLREQFWRDVQVLGSGEELNQSLEKAGRVADFFELAELMCLDALERNESCGGHFREEYQTPEGEALRDDERLLLRRRLGVPGRRQRRRAAQGAAGLRIRAPDATELQVDANLISAHLAAEERRTTPGQHGAVRGRRTSTQDMSFLEMLDVLNEDLIAKGEEPIAFDHDCREGICGMCGVHDQRRGPRPAAAAPPSASCTCATSRTATSCTWSRGARRPSR